MELHDPAPAACGGEGRITGIVGLEAAAMVFA
jgi:hypothetical protein